MFDFSWFLTVPGMLITGGILLLLVALIIFIVTSRGEKEPKEEKPKKEKKGKKADQPIASETVQSVPVDIPTVAPPIMNEAQNVEPVVVDSTTKEAGMGIFPSQTMGIENNRMGNSEMPIPDPSSTIMPTMDPVNQEPSPIIGVNPLPDMTNVQPEMDHSPSIPIEPMPVGMEEGKNVSVYGGVDPTIKTMEQESPRPIYGGANPMDATQSIPIQPVQHFAYGVPVEAPIEEPIVPEVNIPEVSPEPVNIEPIPPVQEVEIPTVTAMETENTIPSAVEIETPVISTMEQETSTIEPVAPIPTVTPSVVPIETEQPVVESVPVVPEVTVTVPTEETPKATAPMDSDIEVLDF